MRAILTYHSIDDSGSPVSVSPARFEAHCRFLAGAGMRVLPLPELLRFPGPGSAVALTFDDGFENFFTQAWPRLEAHGLTATVFVVPGHVGRHNDWNGVRAPGIPHLPLMGWDTLGLLRDRGCALGAHTLSHPRLSDLDRQAVEHEVNGSVEALRRQLGGDVAAFAYPYGDAPAPAVATVRAAGLVGCTTELRPLGTREDEAALPRLDAYYLREAGQMEAWGTAAFRARLWLRALARDLKRSLGRDSIATRGRAA